MATLRIRQSLYRQHNHSQALSSCRQGLLDFSCKLQASHRARMSEFFSNADNRDLWLLEHDVQKILCCFHVIKLFRERESLRDL